jgi:hypothetical protein
VRCKSIANAVLAFRRLQKRNQPRPIGRIFTILKRLNLQLDREGGSRTFYSLRHTYIANIP